MSKDMKVGRDVKRRGGTGIKGVSVWGEELASFSQYSVCLQTGRRVRSPAEAKNFSSPLCDQTISEVH
jgi:hypothetical protein